MHFSALFALAASVASLGAAAPTPEDSDLEKRAPTWQLNIFPGNTACTGAPGYRRISSDSPSGCVAVSGSTGTRFQFLDNNNNNSAISVYADNHCGSFIATYKAAGNTCLNTNNGLYILSYFVVT